MAKSQVPEQQAVLAKDWALEPVKDGAKDNNTLPSPPRFSIELPKPTSDKPNYKPEVVKPVVKPKPKAQEQPTNVSQLTRTWGEKLPIGVKEVSSTRNVEVEQEPATTQVYKRRALPGLAVTPPRSTHQSLPSPVSPPGPGRISTRRSVIDIAKGMRDAQEDQPIPASPVPELKSPSVKPPTNTKPDLGAASREEKRPLNGTPSFSIPANDAPPMPFVKSSPSTAPKDTPAVVATESVSTSAGDEAEEEEHVPVDVRSAIANWGRTPAAPAPVVPSNDNLPIPIPRPNSTLTQSDAAKAERRKSTLEKYSSIMLPPLKEEKTPIPTPTGSLGYKDSSQSGSSTGRSKGSLTTVGTSPGGRTSALDVHRALVDHKALLDLHEPSPVPSPLSTKLKDLPTEVQETSPDDLFVKPHGTINPPVKYDIQKVAATKSLPTNKETFTISVEVMVVSGNTATIVKENHHILYDVEVCAIVHRSKSKSSGLVATEVYGWRGRHGEVKAQEAKKLGDMAGRFGVDLVSSLNFLYFFLF